MARLGGLMNSRRSNSAQIETWLAGPLDAEAKRQIGLMSSLPDARRVVVLPDAHAGSLVCNGTVLATESAIYPDAVGRDIGCGYTAARLSCGSESLRDPRELRLVLGKLGDQIRTLRRRERVARESLCPPCQFSDSGLQSEWRRITSMQLATLGRGNHFIEIQRDEEGRVWIMVHSGSRSLGEAVYLRHTSRASSRYRRIARLERGTPAGDAYLHDAMCAQKWASANRASLLAIAAETLAEVAGASIESSTMIDSSHNTVAVERHHGEELVVHRKSAARAREGEPVLIAGSAATFSVHAVGLGCALSLESCAHGAGRELPRSVAARRFGSREVLRQYGDVAFDTSLADRLRDEAPGAYRDLRPVLRAQRDLARVNRRLVPLLSFKGT